MYSMILIAAISLSNYSFVELEKYYWDCDTAFMKGELGGEDTFTCLAITDEFQKHFWDKFVFSQYWVANKKEQWARRGYKHHDEHED